MKEQALLKQQKEIQELKSKMLCMMYLDKALQQYSTLKLLQKEQGDSRDTNKENIEWSVISPEVE